MTAASPATDYTVASVTFTVAGSKPGTFYTVGCDPMTGRVLDCTCPDHLYRGRTCKHQRLVSTKDHGGLKPHIRIVVRTQPAPATATVWERPAAKPYDESLYN